MHVISGKNEVDNYKERGEEVEEEMVATSGSDAKEGEENFRRKKKRCVKNFFNRARDKDEIKREEREM